jgi:REP element-mobilizing transposase RayT
MSRGVNRSFIFTDDVERLAFGRLLGEAADRFAVEIHAYCLMGTHFHLLLHCPSGDLSRAMHLLLSSFARIVNHRNDRVGHLFGNRFCSRLVTDATYLANVVRYIHQNPSDIPEVGDIGAYRWSSHRTYLGLRPQPEWFRSDTVMGWFDDVNAFDRFVRTPDTAGRELLSAPVSELLASVDLLLTERSDATARHYPAQRRAVMIGLMAHLRSDRHQRIVDELGLETRGALRTAASRARSLRRDEPALDVIIDHVVRLFTHPRPAIQIARQAS